MAERRPYAQPTREPSQLFLSRRTEYHQRFLRPLSSLSLALDFRLFPHNALPLHLENALIYAATVLVVAALYRALDLRAALLGIATLFFAMQAAQSMTVGWISGRSTSWQPCLGSGPCSYT